MAASTFPSVPPSLLRITLVLGVAGALASLYVHLRTFMGVGLGEPAVTLLHAGGLLVCGPVFIALFQGAEVKGMKPDSISGQFALFAWLWRMLMPVERGGVVILGLYVFANFLLGIGFTLASPADEFTTRLFSGHWIWF
ncbi:MAG: hypothetical protein AAF791_15150 [Bacteroidota bacterium]